MEIAIIKKNVCKLIPTLPHLPGEQLKDTDVNSILDDLDGLILYREGSSISAKHSISLYVDVLNK